MDDQVMEPVDGVNMYAEQTECPSCGNREGNLVMANHGDHWHRACGECHINYIVWLR